MFQPQPFISGGYMMYKNYAYSIITVSHKESKVETSEKYEYHKRKNTFLELKRVSIVLF